jgi:hypothetical protein
MKHKPSEFKPLRRAINPTTAAQLTQLGCWLAVAVALASTSTCSAVLQQYRVLVLVLVPVVQELVLCAVVPGANLPCHRPKKQKKNFDDLIIVLTLLMILLWYE